MAEVVYLFGHGVGGRPGERLIKRIGMPTSDDTILCRLKRWVKARGSEKMVRVMGVDDWAWQLIKAAVPSASFTVLRDDPGNVAYLQVQRMQ